LFDEAVELRPDQRETFIANACAGDTDLAQRLRRMLAADARAESDDFLGSPALSPNLRLWDAGGSDYEPGSRRFGAYRLIRLIGAGGMGEVHLAERGDGQFEQRVALKLLPQPTPGLIQRFRQERQILARLEHPHIARLLDGGVGEAQVPYFAMEYIEGVTIVAFGTQRELGVAGILRLFLLVCDAVQYAHRNLVVHRDIKPSNILVDADGAPKLLDFGIAKVLQETGRGDATHTHARAFTPDYAAPEQIRGEAVTTATDVYALGVVLYELLTGARPYKLRRDLPPEQAIHAAAAIAPSAALTAEKSAHGVRRRALLGDLDTVVLTAIAQAPERRYATVEAFANDIRRHLEGRPITARGESAWYRARKFARRNRTGVAAALIVAATLIGATLVSVRQARIATEQAARAEQKSQTAEAVKGYLLSVFASANPYNTDGKVVTARDLLEGGLEQVDKKLAGQPQVQAEIYAGFVDTFLQLNNNALGQRAGELALERYHQFLPADAAEILRLETDLAQADFYRTRFDGLVARFEDLIARTRNRGGEYAAVRADDLTLLSMTHFRMGNYEASVHTSEAALALLRESHAKPYDYDIGIVLYNLFLARLAEGRLTDAAALIGEFTTGDRKIIGPQHPGLITDVVAVGRLLQDAGRLHEAHELYTTALAARRKQFPEKHQFVYNTRGYLADNDCELGDATGSAAVFSELVAALDAPGSEVAANDFARIHFSRAHCLVSLGRFDDARRALDAAREQILRVMDKNNPYPLAMDAAAADVERAAGHADAALALLAPIVARQRERSDRELPASLLAVARADVALGKFDEAQLALAEARDVLDRQGRSSSVVAREVELAWTTVSVGGAPRQGAADHWLRAARIGCVNFGCEDARVRGWQRHAVQTGADAAAVAAIATPPAGAADKPYEAQYALAVDILAQASSPPPASGR